MAFSADLKDFVNAFAAGYQMVPDPEHPSKIKEREAKTKYYEAKAATAGQGDAALDAYRTSRAGYYDELAADKRAERNKPAANAGILDYATQRHGGQRSAIPAAPSAPDASTSGETPKGGVVLHSREGAIPDPADSDALVDEADSATVAVREGLKYAADKTGASKPTAVEDADTSAGVDGYIRGSGAAPKDTMSAVHKIVDPEGKMSESERTMKSLGVVWDYYTSRGETEKAQAAAASMLQHYRVLSQRFKAIAQAAAQEGDLDNAAKAVIRAYSYIPDGQNIDVEQQKDGSYAYKLTDMKTGEVTSEGIATPKELAAAAMRVSPADFDKFIMQAAGRKLPKKETPEPMKFSDRAKRDDQISLAWENLSAENENLTAGLSGNESSVLRATASHIYSDPQNDLTADESVRAAFSLVAVDPKDPDRQNFELKLGEEGAQVKFANNREMFIPRQQFEQLAAIRAQRIKEAQEQISEQQARIERQQAHQERLRKSLREAGGSAGTTTMTPNAP